MKLLYLSERKSFEKFYVPLIGDSLVSMKNGPVLSFTLDRINSGSDKKVIGITILRIVKITIYQSEQTVRFIQLIN